MRRTVVLALLASFGLLASAHAEDPPRTDTGATITQGGAKCDGTTDDTAAVNAYLASFKTGGLVRIPPNRKCLIDSANLVIPPNVIVTGEGAPGPRRAELPIGAGFFLNPAYTIIMQTNSSLRDAVVLRKGLVQNPTNAQVIEAVEAWGKESSHGIAINGDGVRLERLFIEGFNTAIYDFGWGTFIISDVAGDDYNGIFITGAGDNSAIVDTRFEPFYAIHSANAHAGVQAHPTGTQRERGRLRFAADALKAAQVGDYAAILFGPHAGALPVGTKVTSVDPKSGEITLSNPPTTELNDEDVINFGGSWVRPGVSFYLQGNTGGTTGWYCQRCFSFMYRHGAVIDGTGVGTMSDADFEYQHAFDPGTDGAGTFGIRLTGASAGVKIIQSSMGGQSIPFVNDMAPSLAVHIEHVDFGYPDYIITAGVPGPKAIAGSWFSGRTGEPVVVTLGGSTAPGVEQTLVVNSETFTFTGRGGSGPGPILSEWGRALNSNATLAAQHVLAYWAGNSLTIFAPPSVSLDVSPRVSGSITASLSKGQPSGGSWGSVSGFVYGGPPRIPAVVVGAHDELPLTFSNFSGNNDGNMPSGTFEIDPTSQKVQFLTYPVGQAGNNTLSACGRGPSLAAGGTALRGTITEGVAAEGCTMTFPAAFPRAPVCTVSSPTGSPIAGYAVTPQTLTIRNPASSGNRYSFICAP